jgi:hypothetical protein
LFLATYWTLQYFAFFRAPYSFRDWPAPELRNVEL